MIERLQIKADKNCKECEATMLDVDDINIDYMFEDWRECSEHCDECSKADMVNMCALQFEVMSLLANSLAQLRQRQNALASMMLKRDERGAKLLKEQEDLIEKEKEKTQALYQ